VGNVVRSDEGSELLVRRENFAIHRRQDFVRQTLLIRIGKARRKFLERENEGVVGNDALGLLRDFFGDQAHGDKVITHAGAQNVLGLQEGLWNLMQASDVVFVVLYRVQWHRKRQVGKARVNPSAAAR